MVYAASDSGIIQGPALCYPPMLCWVNDCGVLILMKCDRHFKNFDSDGELLMLRLNSRSELREYDMPTIVTSGRGLKWLNTKWLRSRWRYAIEVRKLQDAMLFRV